MKIHPLHLHGLCHREETFAPILSRSFRQSDRGHEPGSEGLESFLETKPISFGIAEYEIGR